LPIRFLSGYLSLNSLGVNYTKSLYFIVFEANLFFGAYLYFSYKSLLLQLALKSIGAKFWLVKMVMIQKKL